MLVLAIIGLAVVLVSLGRAGAQWRTHRRLVRRGLQVRGEVVDLEARHRAYYGGWLLRPEARYRVGEREYRCVLGNATGAYALGSGIDVLVDPDDPYTADAQYGGAAASGLAVTAGMTVVFIALLIWAIALL